MPTDTITLADVISTRSKAKIEISAQARESITDPFELDLYDYIDGITVTAAKYGHQEASTFIRGYASARMLTGTEVLSLYRKHRDNNEENTHE